MRLRRFESFPRHQPSLARLRRASFGSASQTEARRADRSVDAVGKMGSGWRACRAEAVSEARQANRVGGSNSVVESQPSKLLVAGSIPVSRSSLRSRTNAERASARQASQDVACHKAVWG